MVNQHLISDSEERKQSDKKNSITKTPGELENYRNFFKHITSDNDVDLDLDIDTDESAQTMKENFHGR